MSTSFNIAPVLFIPHGGGPMPLLGEPSHEALVKFLRAVPNTFAKPDAIVLISAHWEEQVATITSAANPSLIYDYVGFPPESYQLTYPAPGHPALASQLQTLLKEADINANLSSSRGFDHGMFVPLMLMYPKGDIPVVQLSLLKNFDPAQHIAVGKALRSLREQNVLILGSGFSFHNMHAFFRPNPNDIGNQQFEAWLIDTCTAASEDAEFSHDAAEQALINWKQAPYAKYCHPREEHLLPLHICFGAGNGKAKKVFEDYVLNKKTHALLWD